MLKKKRLSRKEFLDNYFNDDSALEKELGGIVIRTEITESDATVEYLPVREFEYYIDVWDCTPRLGRRVHLGKGAMRTEIVTLNNPEAKQQFQQLAKLRSVIINRSGHYYIETEEQLTLLNEMLKTEGLR